jgi:hypothetical protein
MSSLAPFPSTSISAENDKLMLNPQRVLDAIKGTSVSSGSTTEDDDDISTPHEPIWQDAIFLNYDASAAFELDVSTVLMSEPSPHIEELRLFIHPETSSNTNIHYDNNLKTSIKSILTKYSAISRLYIHIGYHRGEGVLGFEQDTISPAFETGGLVKVASLVVPLFKKHQTPLRRLSLGGHQLLDGGSPTHPGSDLALSEVINVAGLQDALAQVETLDLGISLPMSDSATDQERQVLSQANSFGLLMAKLGNLRDLSIRWDQPYHRVWTHDRSYPRIPVDLQLQFCSLILQSLKFTKILHRLFLRGFSRVSRGVMHSILCQNDQLERLEIAIWRYDYEGFYSEVNHITYSSATNKVDKTSFIDKWHGKKGKENTVTMWQPDGCVTESRLSPETAKTRATHGASITQPASRSEGVRRVLDLLDSCKLVHLRDDVDVLTDKATVQDVAIHGSISALSDGNTNPQASPSTDARTMHVQNRRTTRTRKSASQNDHTRNSQSHVLSGRISKKSRNL